MNLKVLFLFFLIVSCSIPNDPQKSLFLNDTLIIYYQETLVSARENISIKFDSLYENRCPVNVVCSRPGEARILFTFSSGDMSNDFWLSKSGLFSTEFTDDTLIFGYSISLNNIYPYPHTDSSYAEEDYSAEIIISD